MRFRSDILRTLINGMSVHWRRPFTLDLHAIALFRIGLGLLILGDLTTRLSDFGAHYSEEGVMSRAMVDDFSPPASIVPWSQLDQGPWETIVILGVGLSGIGLTLGLASRRCAVVCFLFLGALQSRNPLVLYGADRLLLVMLFWSVFLPLGKRWGLDALRYGRRGVGQVLSGGSFAVVVQVAVVYWFSFLSKNGETWWNGDAVSVVLQLDVYTSDWGRWLGSFDPLMKYLTWGTLIIELGAPLLLLWPHRRARWLGVVLLVGLQFGFAVFMELGWFPYVSLVALVPLIPVGQDSTFTRVTSTETGHTWGTLDWSIVGLAGTMVFVNVAISQMEFQKSRLKAAVPGWLYWSLDVTRLAQSWSMFSPDPPDESGWLLVIGKTEDGREIDLLQGRLMDGEGRRPKDIQESLRSDRWKAYLLNLVQRGLSWNKAAQYLAVEWNDASGKDFQVMSAQVRWTEETGESTVLGNTVIE